MSKARWLVVGGGLLLALAGGLAILYAGWRHVPAFYAEALAATDVAIASDELLEHASTLASDAQRDGRWQALFTARQINGWLAVDMPKNHSTLLSRDVRDPRVSLERDRLRLAFRYGEGPFSTICSVTVGLRTMRGNRLALRVEEVRGGCIPLPMGQVLETLSAQARKANLPLEWRRVAGDPVAIVRLAPLERGETAFMLGNLEVGPDELFVAGVTQAARLAETAREPAEPAAPPISTSLKDVEELRR